LKRKQTVDAEDEDEDDDVAAAEPKEKKGNLLDIKSEYCVV